MKIHEYQAVELFGKYGIPVSDFVLARTPQEVKKAAENRGKVVIKAQVLAGGRGKAGGVKTADSPSEAEAKATEILGMDIKGYKVEKVIVCEATSIASEYYLGMILDRSEKGVTIMLTAEGGMDIEELAASSPDAIHKLTVLPHNLPDDNKFTEFLSQAFNDEKLCAEALKTTKALLSLFKDTDASLVEINPYACNADGKLLALDGKINFDDNALYRQPKIEAMRNPEEENADEVEAREKNLSFVSLDGEIGCIVNGAGLAMATLDIIKHYGGEPANFLDVGGSSNPQKVADALSIILRNPKVKAVLINIFGGITRCDDIAKGLLMAREMLEINVPLVIRLVGTNQTEGRKMLEEAGISALDKLDDAVKEAIRVAGEVA